MGDKKGQTEIDVEAEYEEDLYLLELHKRLTEMKLERKKAQKNADLLTNRLKLLKGEEEKTWKKIEVTRNKTQEKMAYLEKIEENIKKKLEFKEQKEKELETQKYDNTNMKSSIESNIKKKKDEKLKQLLEETRLLKEQKKNNAELIKYIKIEEQNTNKNKYEFIKAQQLLSEEKKRAQEIERKNKLKSDLENKILEEQKLKEDFESKVTLLEDEEVDIMKRIKTTTQVHKSMVEDLGNLSLNTKNNFGNNNNNNNVNTSTKTNNKIVQSNLKKENNNYSEEEEDEPPVKNNNFKPNPKIEIGANLNSNNNKVSINTNKSIEPSSKPVSNPIGFSSGLGKKK